ncbi:YggS family pyridoxal phosphate-dependent enzyme [Neolewinella litorea]|uniref:Pyridoxal phosphate homeostasis protein n=1 Tax=Neolewinella litorea TaxID=2562452 RepID=A0A4S4NMR7_9BACT|nr:YggS family pyridoxal phosphate-dependent enzyme [Neolewinella litorea]THH41236.1 YggS family pyridoxal phosphate-dependent enzyme [Neolewinella litorea]
MPKLSDDYSTLSREVAAAGARLVVVTKTHPVELIQELYDLGHRDFGENRVAELEEKHARLPKDINWHFIGHLQRNKVKNVLPLVSLIHSGDSLRLLREMDKRADDSRVDVLLQYHIAEEKSKYGLTPESGRELLESIRKEPLENVRILGVMGMATYTDDKEQVAQEFRTLHEIYSSVKAEYFEEEPTFSEISMGMSGDYEVALQQGSTLVRIGSLLLGKRNYD